MRTTSRLACCVVLVFACTVLIGWAARIAELASTSVASALGFGLGAIAILGLSRTGPAFLPHQRILQACAAVSLVPALFILGGYVSGDPEAGYLFGPDFGQMPPATAACFTLLAGAVAGTFWKKGWVSVWLGAAGLVIVELDILGHALGIDALYHAMPLSSMGLTTAIAFAVLFLARTLAVPERGWGPYAARGDRMGWTFRILLLTIVLAPFLLTGLASLGVDHELFAPPFAFAVVTVGMTVTLGGMLCFVWAGFSRTDMALGQAEEQLRDKVQLLDTAMDITRLGAWVSDIPAQDGAPAHVEWSNETCQIFGVEKEAFDGLFGTVMSFMHPDDRPAVEASFRTASRLDTPLRLEHRIVRPDGAVRWVRGQMRAKHVPGQTSRMVGVVQDITDLRLIEQQLAQAQKMEAIGNLTGGMAHDFNNLLGVIVGCLDLVSDNVTDADSAELIGEARDAALRGADLNRRLLAYARRQMLQPNRVDPNELIGGIVALLNRTPDGAVEIVLDLSPALLPVIVDPAQLEASIVNLATNARDAMPKGGRLIITTANQQLDQDYADLHDEVEPGDYVMIEVRDTGTGMPPDILARIFDPFFTTKEQGKGTGLGLSMVFGFLKQSGGHINVHSEPGAGTTFRLYLPCAEQEVEGTPHRSAPAQAIGGDERVLVVEDNGAMRRVLVRQLHELGYRVSEADTGIAAREILTREKVDLLFTDIVMPGGLDGLELATAALAEHPALKVILTSGFSEAKLHTDGKALNGLRLLNKPYRKNELARTLREVLQRPS